MVIVIIFYILIKITISAFKNNVYLIAIQFLQKKSSLYNYLLHSNLVFLFMYVSIKKVPNPWWFGTSYSCTIIMVK